MLKEIVEQPDTVKNCIDEYIDRIVGKLNPLLWEIFPIMLAKKNTNNPASNDPVKTTKKFRSQNKYKADIKENPTIV